MSTVANEMPDMFALLMAHMSLAAGNLLAPLISSGASLMKVTARRR